MSATVESGARRSAWITSWGFCQVSRFGSSNTCDHFSASPNSCSCVCGACAATLATKLTTTAKPRGASLTIGGTTKAPLVPARCQPRSRGVLARAPVHCTGAGIRRPRPRQAALGPVDPQLGDMPAASIVKVVEIKGAQRVGDEFLMLADMAQKARIQVATFVTQVLLKHMPEKQSLQVATVLTEGRWTHDYPITVQAAPQLGLKVTTDMPLMVYALMELYPQGGGIRPSVWYVPLRRTPGAPGGPQSTPAARPEGKSPAP